MLINPDRIKEAAAKKVIPFLKAELRGEAFEPWAVPFRKPQASELSFSDADQWITILRRNAKCEGGRKYGYQIEFRNRRFHGMNMIPHRIYFDSAEDVFQFSGRHKEVVGARSSYQLIVDRFPALLDWCVSNITNIIKHTSEWPTFISILEAYLENPRPNCYLREFAAAPHSKYLERHSKLLSELLDILAPDSAIDRSTVDFCKRYGFSDKPTTFWVRFLDQEYAPIGIPGDWVGLPIEDLRELSLPEKILISENRIPILSLPAYRDTLCVWGSGGAAALLSEEPWLESRDVYYWGDIDVHGLQIYGNLKANVPALKSVLMESELLERFDELVGCYDKSVPALPENLDTDERALYLQLSEHQLRLEQELIPHQYVLEYLAELGFRHRT